MPDNVTRRGLITSTLITGSFLVLGERLTLTPAEATELGFTSEVLSTEQLSAIETVAEHIVPGSHRAGIAAYIDSQLNAGEHSLLIGKYLGVDTSGQIAFYENLAHNLVAALRTEQSIQEIVGALWSDSLGTWEGPPSSYMLFVLRADALDVTYGTPKGFEALGIPYMAHIMPETPW